MIKEITLLVYQVMKSVNKKFVIFYLDKQKIISEELIINQSDENM